MKKEVKNLLRAIEEGKKYPEIKPLMDGLSEEARKENIDTILSETVGANNLDVMQGLIATGVNVSGLAILNKAVRQDKLEMVRVLLTAGADINKLDYYGETPLMIAAKSNRSLKSAEMVRELIAAGANVNMQDPNGNTALMYAAEHGQEETVRELIARGADVNIRNKAGETALFKSLSNHYMYLKIEPILEELSDQEVIKQFREKIGEFNYLKLAVQKGKKYQEIKPLIDSVDWSSSMISNILYYALGANNLDAIEGLKGLISPKIDVDTLSIMLNFAAQCNNLEMVRVLLAAGANIDTVDKNGNTPLIFAARNGNLEIVIELLQGGADVNKEAVLYYPKERRVTTNTALMAAMNSINTEALKNENLQVIRELIAGGAVIDKRNSNGYTALMCAAQWGKLEAVRELIARGADVKKLNSAGWTTLMCAAAGNGEKVAEVVRELAREVDVNIQDGDGNTALMHAVKSGQKEEVVRELIARGADVNIQNKAGETALMYAAAGNLEAIRELIAAGADVNKLDNTGKTALMYGVVGCWTKERKEEVVRELINAGANVNIQDKEGTALIHALKFGQWGTLRGIRTLIAGGAVIDKQDSNGSTALMCAAKCGDLEAVRELIAAGADVNKLDNTGKTALMYTPAEWCQKGEEVVRELINGGANINRQDRDGNTALMHAVKSGKEEVVRELIDSGADVNIRDNAGKTALSEALHNRNWDGETIQVLARLSNEEAKKQAQDEVKRYPYMADKFREEGKKVQENPMELSL